MCIVNKIAFFGLFTLMYTEVSYKEDYYRNNYNPEIILPTQQNAYLRRFKHWPPAIPTNYGFVCTLFVPRHSTLNHDPYSATPISSSILIFVLSSKGAIYSINVSQQIVAPGIFDSKVYTELYFIYTINPCLKYLQRRN
jgi:hypothetical protein